MGHIHEKIDFTASVYIVHENKILLHKHKKLDMWLQVGGHIELDEDPPTAARREAKEECGLDIELIGISGGQTYADESADLLVPFFINRHKVSETHEHIDMAYLGKVIGGELRPEEGYGELRWLTKEEIENEIVPLLPNVKVHCLFALEKLKYLKV